MTDGHTCNWLGCSAYVPHDKWACRVHWFRLPDEIRSRILSTYAPNKKPTDKYAHAYNVAIAWIKEQPVDKKQPYSRRFK